METAIIQKLAALNAEFYEAHGENFADTRPRLPSGTEWPQIDGEPADFLAQIDCASLPPALWNGLGPR
ncbi:MAG: DUF1963 domain-containing protein, partial [Anaerolineales bacterium]|nr:DUF1963 domain-containing protein [Anaerolineales bacterium]